MLLCIFCSCKPRIRGRQCDRCAQGYYRFPECLPCECNQGGVTADVCHPDTGRCLCKVSSSQQTTDLETLLIGFYTFPFRLISSLQKNVEGVRCDTCREGSFYFDPSNLLGCSSCFCFEVTNQCQSSNKRRGKVGLPPETASLTITRHILCRVLWVKICKKYNII